MGTQLVLIEENDPEWRLDEHTVEVGLRGIAAARKVLHGDDGRGPRPVTERPATGRPVTERPATERPTNGQPATGHPSRAA